MPKFKAFIKQFHWKILLIRILANGCALVFTAMIIPDIYFVTRTFLAIVLVSIGLGILNAIVKPIVLLLTGQFIFATFGLLVILVNALILYLLDWLFPNIFVVNNFFWALVGGAVLGLVSNTLENLLGLTPPIVPEADVELRKRIEAEQQATLVKLVAKPQTVVQHDVETQSVPDLTAAKAALDTLQVETAPAASSLPDKENLSEEPESNPPPPDASQMQGPETQEPQFDEKMDPNSNGGAA